MIVFPNCKINLGLNILRKRIDGYHDLETIFYPLKLTDALEIIEHQIDWDHMPPFNSSGLDIAGKPASNLCVKAYRLIKKDFPLLPAVHIHLHKVIPSGAGLGGGSADGAFTLKLLNELFNLAIPVEKLIEYASELGSDCPFFIINEPCFGQGRGDILEKIQLDLSPYNIVLVNPGIHVDTGRAFLNMHPKMPEKSILDIIRQEPHRWKDELFNDFEKLIFPSHREIVDIKDYLYFNGALYASMSGSGSSVFGIFPKDRVPKLKFPETYFYKILPG